MFHGEVVAEAGLGDLGEVLGAGDGLGDVGVMILGSGAGLAGVTGVVSGMMFFFSSPEGMLGQSPFLLVSWMKLTPLQLLCFSPPGDLLPF